MSACPPYKHQSTVFAPLLFQWRDLWNSIKPRPQGPFWVKATFTITKLQEASLQTTVTGLRRLSVHYVLLLQSAWATRVANTRNKFLRSHLLVRSILLVAIFAMELLSTGLSSSSPFHLQSILSSVACTVQIPPPPPYAHLAWHDCSTDMTNVPTSWYYAKQVMSVSC